jgi:AbrB family looped-hinge helix DNA binding protein
MPEIAYLSSTGEVKIPLRLRTKLGLQAGDKFEVGVKDGGLLLKRAGLPSDDQLAQFLAWTRKNGKRATSQRVTIGGGANPRRVRSVTQPPKRLGAKKSPIRSRRR